MKIRIWDDEYEKPYIETPNDIIMLDMQKLCDILKKKGILEEVFSEYLGEKVDEVEVI